MLFSRTDDSLAARWWFTVDLRLAAALLGLVGVGLVVSLAASPAVAVKKGFAPFHFAERQFVFAGLGIAVMLAASLLTPRGVRRAALITLIVSLAAMVAVLVTGEEINGARRWLRFAGFSLQPSEFAKPAIFIMSAWALSEIERRSDMPARSVAVGLLIIPVVLLVLQPDIGQTLLITLVWGALFFISGRSLAVAAALAAIAVGGVALAYLSFPHVQNRFDRFLAPGSGDNTQIERALQSFAEGGFLGRGPGEGTIKMILPDAHTDFIFAVIAEEFGIVACLGLVALFALIVGRGLMHAAREHDPFTRLAITGLALGFALQALINMSVNVGLAPAKGMTLPFISAGGSSTLAISLTMGFLLALTRRRPDPARLKMPRWTGTDMSRDRLRYEPP